MKIININKIKDHLISSLLSLLVTIIGGLILFYVFGVT